MVQLVQPPTRVLVLDADMAPALTIARSLHQYGLWVDIASHTPRPLASYSRSARSTLTYPDPTLYAAAFVDWLAAQMLKTPYALVIPVTERSIVPMLKHREKLPEHGIALASDAALEVALDKARTLALAKQLGIPSPRSTAIDQIDQLDLQNIGLDFPIVVKPARSIGSRDNHLVQLGVSYAFNANELRAQVISALRFGSVLLQEYVQGQGVGIELIADQGKIVYAFQHLRLHEVPLTGGGSSLRTSVAINPVLLDASARLMQALAWHGVAMVEFKHNPATGDFRLMEINGRFWGSLPLAVAAGADFPAMLYELMVLGKIKPRSAATLGLYGRKLSSDIYWSELVLRRDAPAKLVTLPNRTTLLRDWLLIFSPRHHFDIQHWRDPKPGLVDLWRIFQIYRARLQILIRDKKLARRLSAAWRNGLVAQRLANANSVLFLCYGNINRSALAEQCFIAHSSGIQIACASAGFHEETGRAADPGIVAAAQTLGINMSRSVSRRVDGDMIDAAGIIFVMEYEHYRRISAHFPAALGRTFLLSPSGEIADPYGKSPETYECCAREIVKQIQHIATLLTARQRN